MSYLLHRSTARAHLQYPHSTALKFSLRTLGTYAVLLLSLPIWEIHPLKANKQNNCLGKGQFWLKFLATSKVTHSKHITNILIKGEAPLKIYTERINISYGVAEHSKPTSLNSVSESCYFPWVPCPGKRWFTGSNCHRAQRRLFKHKLLFTHLSFAIQVCTTWLAD